MGWYYLKDGQETGPLGKEEMQALVKSGAIVKETQLRSENSQTWTTYGQLLNASARKRAESAQPSGQRNAASGVAAGRADSGKDATCSECGGAFDSDELISYQDARICASCKPVFFQKLKEGVAKTRLMNYAGFWIRCGAKIIDGILLGIANFLMGLAVGLIIQAPTAPGPENLMTVLAVTSFTFLLQISLAAGYNSFFLGKYAATPGKMALGLKVVRSDGSSINYMRGFGRYFAEMLSSIILLIGYIMVAFDKEKRALHDHICDTRVIRRQE